jgi:hypothetical protein
MGTSTPFRDFIFTPTVPEKPNVTLLISDPYKNGHALPPVDFRFFFSGPSVGYRSTRLPFCRLLNAAQAISGPQLRPRG